MRFLPLALLLFAACAAPPKPFDPDAPSRYRVLRGDTWSTIGSKRECSREELLLWNGLPERQVLIPGMILWIYPNGIPDDVQVAVAPGAADDTPKDAVVAAAAPKTERTRTAPQVAVAPADAPEIPGPKGGVAPIGGGTNLLSFLDDLDEGPELKAVPSVRVDKTRSSALGSRGDMSGGTEIDDATVKIDRIVDPTSAARLDGPASIPQLPKASAKTCLGINLSALADPGEKGMVVPEGLSKQAIRAGMGPALRAVSQCLPADAKGTYEIHVEVSVGCDGLVYGSYVVKSGGLPESISSCVAGVTAQLSFNAAAGATTFLYPYRIAQ